MFDPNDFAGDPYGGGTNQLGHVTFGAAISGALLLGFGLVLGVLLAGLLVVGWEVYQRKFRGATLLDMKADLAYWLVGVVSWGGICWAVGPAWYLALWPWVPCAAFVVEYARIERA